MITVFTGDFTTTTTHIPVTNITGIPTTATATLPLTLIGTVVPGNATNQTITWSVQSGGTTGANIPTGTNVLYTTNSGTATVLATITNGASPTASFTQSFPITVTKATLGGTITISGNTIFGQMLTAVSTGLNSTPTIPNLGTLSYQWKRNNDNISGATNATYTLIQAAIGATITVSITATNCNGEVTADPTETVTKATKTAPEAPTMASNTTTSITLEIVTGCEYKINDDTYQVSNLFSGLTPNTSYCFTQRYAETATHLASNPSHTAEFSTKDDVGINENTPVNINVYPNPTNSQVIIENGQLKTENEEYRIYSAIGQLLVQGKLQEETTIINLTSLANGMYYLKIAEQTVKFVKQ
jgi:hypothetical protein